MRRSALAAVLVSVATALAGVAVYAAATPAVGSGPGGCFDPVDLGAVSDDGVDDRAPIQAASDAAVGAGGGSVCLRSGRWTLTRAPVGSYDRTAALSTHGAHLSISGTGPGTVLELVGDQGSGATSVISLDPGATDVTVQRLTIDTSAATNTDEQTHAIAIGSGVCSTANGTCSLPVSDVTVRDVRFAHPRSPSGQRKGDCIRLLGNTAATSVKRVTISGSSFTSCARSAIGVQRNVRSLAVLGNHFGEEIGDTAFDGEPTGGEGDDGLRLIGNSFADSRATFSASLTSYAHATVTGNTFAGRGLSLYRTRDVVVADNTFEVTAVTGAGAIEVQNVAGGDKIHGNVIRRHGVPGPAIRIIPHSGGVPEHVSVTDNTIILDGDANAIYGESARDIAIRDNDITFMDPAPNGSGIFLRATVQAMDGVTITGNTVSAPFSPAGADTYYAAVRLAASPFPIDGVTVALNASRAAIRSLTCTQATAGNFRSPIVSVANRWNVDPTCAAATLTSGQ